MHSNSLKKKFREQGSSLVEILVALGVGGIILVATNKLLNDTIRAAKHIERRAELISVQQVILKSLSCSRTLDLKPGEKVSACSDFAPKNIRGDAVANTEGRVGDTNVYLRTRCVLEKGLFFDYMWAQKENGKLRQLPDPLSGMVPEGYRDLFPSEPFCQEYFGDTEEAGEEASANSIPDVTCAPGRHFGGFVNGEPVCGNTAEDLLGPPVYKIGEATPARTIKSACLGVPGLGETCIVTATDPSPGKMSFFGEFITMTPKCNIKKITTDTVVSYVEQCL